MQRLAAAGGKVPIIITRACGGSTGAITSAGAGALTGAAAATAASGFAAVTAVRAVRLRCASAASSCFRVSRNFDFVPLAVLMLIPRSI